MNTILGSENNLVVMEQRMIRTFGLALLVAVLLVAIGCHSEESAMCDDAISLCGSAATIQMGGECRGDVRTYASCIVGRGDCTPQTLTFCSDTDIPDEDQPAGGDESGICARFLECVAGVAPMELPSLQEYYGAEGGCWITSATELCEQACITALSQLRTTSRGDPACACLEDADCQEPGVGYCDLLSGMCGECSSSSHCSGSPMTCVRTESGPSCLDCNDAIDHDGPSCGYSWLSGAEIWSAAPLCVFQGSTTICIGCQTDADCGSSACDPETRRCGAANPSCLGIWECMRHAPVDCSLAGSCCDQQRCPESPDYTICMMNSCWRCTSFDECRSCSVENCRAEYQACDSSCID